MGSRLTLIVLRGLAWLPLPLLRAMGWGLGQLLYGLARPRRHITQTNLRLCFPALSPAQVNALARQVFVRFCQAWLDRGWLWHRSAEVTRLRLRLCGAVQALQGSDPVVVFAPHFVGLDAGWTALTQQLHQRRFCTIYTNQANAVMDQWILSGRSRFANARLFGRVDGVKTIVASLRAGEPLYLLPDMNFGPQESVFVPFYGVAAATVPSLSRFAKLARAKVVPVVTRMTAQGYDVEVLPAWADFPTQDTTADTALMNQRLQTYIDTMTDQYYWVHRRFKDRPDGVRGVY